MCISIAPAELTGTRLYAAEAKHPKTGAYIHVMGYQNKAKNRAAGPNAMILPIPSAAPLTNTNMIDTTDYPKFLERMAEALRPRFRGLATKSFGGDDELSRGVEVFNRGSYTVVLAANPDDIPAALALVPANKRPPANPELFAAYNTLYPGQPVALCCWNGAIEPEPLLWWYEPSDPSRLFMPALDGHDGGLPTHEDVKVDHTLIYGSCLHEIPKGIKWNDDNDVPPVLRPLLASHIRGTTLTRTRLPNGDFYVPLNQSFAPSGGQMVIGQHPNLQRLPPAGLAEVARARLAKQWGKTIA